MQGLAAISFGDVSAGVLLTCPGSQVSSHNPAKTIQLSFLGIPLRQSCPFRVCAPKITGSVAQAWSPTPSFASVSFQQNLLS